VQLIQAESISLRNHPELDEKWLQARVQERPSMLGLGDLVVRDKERIQPRAGRLDLLLQDIETDRRYEVEIQLGSTDESHIIRTIEYWDIERKRYPQYDHCAVIVAEEITARFLNVISLFNGSVPLIAIKLTAYALNSGILLTFTTVLDELSRGLVDEDEEVALQTDRGYWEERSNKETVSMADRLLEVARKFDPTLSLKYNKFYIGLARDGQPHNFAIFRPQKGHIRFDPSLDYSEELERELTDAGLDLLPYDKRSGRVRVRLLPAELTRHAELVTDLMRRAYEQSKT
jgi:hypothetical protein